MANTTVDNIIASVKRRVDYDITDSALDILLLDILDDGVRWTRQKLMDAGLNAQISKTASFVVLSGDDNADMRNSKIVGSVSTFTGVTGDKINLTIDGAATDDIDISGDTTIQEVADAINAVTALGTEATLDDDGNLLITSATTDGTGTVTIADGTTTTLTVIARLFSLARNRTDTGIADFGTPLRFREKDNDTLIRLHGFEDLVEFEPDETQSTTSTPHMVAQWDGENKLFFRPALSTSLRIYVDYFAAHTVLASGGTLPFKDQYDPVLKQFMRVEFFAWKFADDPNNPQLLREEAKLSSIESDLISAASKNFNMNRQTKSRRGAGFGGPKRNVGTPIYES